jgi:ribosomal protein S18 acetylase RimI-like enzyme
VVIIREYDSSRDGTALCDCIIVLQNCERQFDPGKPEGAAIAEAYLNRMLARCREWDGQVFVAEIAGQVAGFVCVWARVKPDEPDDDPAQNAFVSDVVVMANHGRRGIGSRLLSAAEGYARARGTQSLGIGVLAHNAAARRLFESAGFGENEIEVTKRLG